MKPLISIVVPIYNMEKTVGECIQGILSQSFKDFELIIVDDCSDNAEYINEFNDDRIVFIRNDHNLGSPASRNNGVNIAKGKYIFFTDADCIPSRYWLEEGLRFFKEKKCEGIEGRIFYLEDFPTFSDRVLANLDGNQWMTANVAYTKEIIGGSGGFDEKIMLKEDRNFALSILEDGGEIIFNENMIVFHQKRLYSIKSFLKRVESVKCHIQILKNHNQLHDLNRIIYGKKLLLFFFPPLVLLNLIKHRYVTSLDFKLFLFSYIQIVYLRLLVWKTAIEERVFVI